MPRKQTATKKTKKPKTSTSKSSKNKKPVEEVKHDVVSDIEEPVPKKKRNAPTKESVTSEFDALIVSIQEEIDRLRETPGKQKGIKFLRSLNKQVKVVRSHSTRVMKKKHKTKRENNNNSGFLKPVKISKEMAKFTGWDQKELRSRVDVTKYICEYIRKNNLQNPDDRRQIVADKKLSKLLGYDAKTAEDPLTYYRIQTYMKKHFTNPSST